MEHIQHMMLVGGWALPLWTIRVSWDDEFPNWMENTKCSKPPARYALPSGKRLHSELKRSTMLYLVRKSAINGPLSIAMLSYQRIPQTGSKNYHKICILWSYLLLLACWTLDQRNSKDLLVWRHTPRTGSPSGLSPRKSGWSITTAVQIWW